jgi:hypothetical protein
MNGATVVVSNRGTKCPVTNPPANEATPTKVTTKIARIIFKALFMGLFTGSFMGSWVPPGAMPVNQACFYHNGIKTG